MEQQTHLINLESLISFSAKLTETYNKEFILNSALLSIMGKLKILRSCVLIPSEENHFSIILTKGKLLHNSRFTDSQFENIKINDIENILLEFGIIHYLPIIYQNNTLAVLCFGNKINNTAITYEEEQYINLIASITANALQNAINHQSLVEEKQIAESRSQLLTTLFEISHDFSNLMSREEILRMLSYHLMGQLMISKFAVFLLRENDTFYPIFNRLTSDETVEVTCCMDLFYQARLITNIQCDDITLLEFKKLGAEIIAPMMIQNQIKGLLIVGKKLAGGEFTSQNIQFIEAIASIAMMALENERLFKEEIEKKLLENEVELALDIQKNLLPKSVPICQNFEMFGATYPSRYVGGDYFDFITLPDGRIFVAIADVSGKGVPASLIMASVQAVLRIITPMSISITEIVQRLNKLLYENTSSDKFVTFFCCILDDKNRTIEYLNAGHNPPILYKRTGQIIRLTEGGLILGFLPEIEKYDSKTITLDRGDIILLFTDGVSEAINDNDEEFGEGKIIEYIIENGHYDAQSFLNGLINKVQTFSGEKQYDDITSIVVKEK